MRAHSQTIAPRPQVGVTMDVGGLDWFQRLCEWFSGRLHGPRKIASVSAYGTWDAERERFRQMRADAAADIVAAQNGTVWTEQIYSASI